MMAGAELLKEGQKYKKAPDPLELPSAAVPALGSCDFGDYGGRPA